MGSKPSRAEVGRKVADLASKLSDELLIDEFDAKQAMEALFTGALPRISELSEKVEWNTVPATVESLTTSARAMVQATQAPFANLCSTAARKALNSIGQELDLCEETLAKRYEGITDEAIMLTRRYANEIVMLMAEQYLTQAMTSVDWSRARFESELRTSLRLEEEPGVRLARLIAPDSVRGLTDHHGRGLWWKVLEHCNRVTREAEIACVNTIRERAMQEFNEAGERRDSPSP